MTFEQSIVIAATPAELFALTQDYARRLEWDPWTLTRTCPLAPGRRAAGLPPGATGKGCLVEEDA